jgi:hypothetical protein
MTNSTLNSLTAASDLTGAAFYGAQSGSKKFPVSLLNSAYAAAGATSTSLAGISTSLANVSTSLASVTNAFVNARLFGALGNGSTDDAAAIQAACDYAAAQGGGEVFLPATGNAYKVGSTIALGNGVVLRGTLANNFAGATATNAQWAENGSWLNPTHANPAVRLQGHGSGISGINFIHVQPTPSGTPSTTWTPNTYGYCISVEASHTTVEDIMIVNASHGVFYDYTTGSGGGTRCRMRDVIVSAFTVRLRTSNVNDTMYWSNIHCRNLWYNSNSNVVDHLYANTRGWQCGYTDNIMVNGLEFFEDAEAIYLENQTCLGVTHSLYNGQLVNLQFNLPKICMKVAATTTDFKAYVANLLAQTGNSFGRTWSDTAFQLGSNNAVLRVSNMVVKECGGVLMTIGNGSGGRVRIDGLNVDAYSSIASGQVCFSVGAGAFLELSNYKIVKASGNGARFAGSGIENVSTDAFGGVLYHGRYSESVLSGTGSFATFTTDSLLRPGQMRAHQVKLVGEFEVQVASGSTTASIRVGSGLAQQASIDTGTTGWKNFDTGWTDIAQASLDSLAVVGRVEINAAVGVTIGSGSTNVLFR